MGKIGVYGGSFDPPHLGHVLAVREMAAALKLDRVLLIPAATPPHKPLPPNSPDGATRLEMLRLAVSGLPDVEVSAIELERSGPSYTADTVRELAAKYPGDKLYLLMGTDMFLSFDRWYEPKSICRCASLVTVRRADADGKREIEAQARALRRQLGAKVTILDNDYLEMSSTEVRRMLRFDCAEAYLDPSVLAYIRARGLYGVGESLKGLPFDELRRVSLSLHDPRRVPHVCGCCETAARLARKYGADETAAARAGILHDITKALSRSAQLHLCEKYGIMTSAFEKKHYKLLHAKTGAAVARHVFGESDAVSDAIFWHTTGHADMTTLEKILYIADYMEPHRDFEGVEKLRALVDKDLDAALLCGFEMSIELLEREGKPLDRYTVEARDFLLHERNRT